MTEFRILFWFYNDQQQIEKVKNGCYFLAHADTWFTSAVKTVEPEVVPLYSDLFTTIVLFFVYIDKIPDHVRIVYRQNTGSC